MVDDANTPLITVDGVTVRLRDRWLLNGSSWQINTGEQWAIIGPNGAGKTTLAKAIAGLLPVVQGKIHYHALAGAAPVDVIAYVASDARRDIRRLERELDHQRSFAGRFNDATTIRDLMHDRLPDHLPAAERSVRLADVVDRFALTPHLDKPAAAISTGEMSRVLIARELIRRPKMLILDEPFEGLDRPGRETLAAMLDRLAISGLPLLLITHRPEELLPAISHVLTIDKGRITGAAPVNSSIGSFFSAPAAPPRQNAPQRPRRCPEPGSNDRHRPPRRLIDMQAVRVRYGGTVVLDRLTWTVGEGEHWAVTGPNGAGKSTLLKLITGECLQVYANRIRLFGRDRGRDQTLGETRAELGVVSHDLASGYQKRMSALDVVCSGFFDSVGLYRHCDGEQLGIARSWLEELGLQALAGAPFNQLSQGQRQMVLIARAMVKSPKLLILDEPCAGLDPQNRRAVLRLVERIGRGGASGLIFVSHHEAEIPDCTTHRLRLDGGRVVYRGPIGEVDSSKVKVQS
jgi:molybdate transport system ATP-binding protein